MKSRAEQRHGAAPPVQWRDSHRNSVRLHQQLSKTSPGEKKRKKTKLTTVWRVATRHQWKTNVYETLTNGVKADAWSVRDRRAIGGVGGTWLRWACGGSQQCQCKLAELRLRIWAKGRSLQAPCSSETSLCVWSACTAIHTARGAEIVSQTRRSNNTLTTNLLMTVN